MAVRYRASCNIKADDIHCALAKLPVTCFGKTCAAKARFYPSRNAEHVPSWSAAQRFVPRLTELVRASTGRGVLHVCMRTGVSSWNDLNELGMNCDQVEDVAYSLRLIINQLLNTKGHDRKVPRPWQPKFGVIFEMLQ